MPHEPQLIVRIPVPGIVHPQRPGRLPAASVALVHGVIQAEVVFELVHGIEGVPDEVQTPMLEFSPPPGMSNSGKPEPASS